MEMNIGGNGDWLGVILAVCAMTGQLIKVNHVRGEHFSVPGTVTLTPLLHNV